MLETLIYRVAGRYIRLHTPSLERSRELLANYKPFRVDSIPEGGDVVLDIYGSFSPSTELQHELLEEVNETTFTSKMWRTATGQYYCLSETKETKLGSWIDLETREMRVTTSLTSAKGYNLLDKAISIAFGLVTLPLGLIKVHASAISIAEQALIFLGVSGTGKSTHSRQWRTYYPESLLLNDDEPIIEVCPDESVYIWGAPWSGSTPCYVDARRRLVGIVQLQQHPENILTKLKGREAFHSLFSSVGMIPSLSQTVRQAFDLVSRTLGSVPAYRLACRPDREAAELTRSLMTI